MMATKSMGNYMVLSNFEQYPTIRVISGYSYYIYIYVIIIVIIYIYIYMYNVTIVTLYTIPGTNSITTQ